MKNKMKKITKMPNVFSGLAGNNVMSIRGGFASITVDTRAEEGLAPDFITDEHFKEVAESGVNVVLCYINYEWEPELLIKSMDLAHKYGMGYVVWDSWLTDRVLSNDLPTLKELEERVDHYCHHPAFCGVQLLDEPTSENFMPNPKKNISNFGDVIRLLKEAKIVHSQCLLPLYGYDVDGQQDKKEVEEKYKAYLREYFDVFQPEIFSYDHYPFTNQAPRLERFFWNMSAVREIAQEHGVPFGVTIQAGGQWNDRCGHFDSIPYYPAEGQFYWNVNVCLAMGTKMIGYFPVVQPFHFSWAKTEKYDFERNGFFGHDGRKNPWYYYAQNINKQIAAIDEVLVNAENEGVIANGTQAEYDLQTTSCLIETKVYRELVGVEGETLIGCFDYEGKTALYVVNYDMEASQKIDLRFKETCNVSIIQNAETHFDVAETLELDMTAGEGILIVVE